MSASRRKRIARHARTARVRERLHPSFTGPLFDVWRRARTIWEQLCDKFQTTPVALACSERVTRERHKLIAHWLFNLESLVRPLILAAALALRVTSGTGGSDKRPARNTRRVRRRVLIWPDKPETWIRLSFSIFPRAGASRARSLTQPSTPARFRDSLPLARRLHALRRVLCDPQAAARRAAFHLARLAAADRVSNQPRRFVMDQDKLLTRPLTLGELIVRSAFEKLDPFLDDRIDAWNRRAEPG